MIYVRIRESRWHNWVNHRFQDDDYENAYSYFQSSATDWSEGEIILTAGIAGDEVILEEYRE